MSRQIHQYCLILQEEAWYKNRENLGCGLRVSELEASRKEYACILTTASTSLIDSATTCLVLPSVTLVGLSGFLPSQSLHFCTGSHPVLHIQCTLSPSYAALSIFHPLLQHCPVEFSIMMKMFSGLSNTVATSYVWLNVVNY